MGVAIKHMGVGGKEQDGGLLTSQYLAVTNYPEKGRSEDPKKHPWGPITSKKQSPLQICKERSN
jgi:hypothetical protein